MKPLILYYSYTGNTKKIAELVQRVTGWEIAGLETVTPYSNDYDTVVNQGQREVSSGFMPVLKPLQVNLAAYDSIILGTPVWWYTFAPAVKTFLSDVDLSGKTIYPFATNGGWVGHTFKDLEKACAGADVKAGMDISFNGKSLSTPEYKIRNWIKRLK